MTWPGHVRYFSLTSGTTMAGSKAMPVSAEAMRANRRAAAALLATILERVPGADPLRGKTLYLGGSTALTPRGACLVGDASGIGAARLPRLVRRYRLPEPDVAAMTDWREKVEAVCDRYLDEPVRIVVGLPSWALLLFRRLIERARERGRRAETVKDVWPDLKAFVHYGMAFAPWRGPLLAAMGDGVATFDTYSSSEGGLNAIQGRPGEPGMRLLPDVGVFYEFVPLDEAGRPGARRLGLSGVEAGECYALLLSTCAGIWAYDVGDVVRFTSVDPPEIVFATRTKHQLNTFGEHVIEEHLEAAMARACAATGVRIRDFAVGVVEPTREAPRGRHRWFVEPEGPAPRDGGRFAAELDAGVVAGSDDYAAHRAGDFGLLPPEVVWLPAGTVDRWLAAHGGLGAQRKFPRLAPPDLPAAAVPPG